MHPQGADFILSIDESSPLDFQTQSSGIYKDSGYFHGCRGKQPALLAI